MWKRKHKIDLQVIACSIWCWVKPMSRICRITGVIGFGRCTVAATGRDFTFLAWTTNVQVSYFNRNSILLTTKQVVAIINNNCARFSFAQKIGKWEKSQLSQTSLLYYIPCCWVLIWYQGGVVLS